MIATEADIPLIVELGAEAHAASLWPTGLAAFDAEDFAASCRFLMNDEDGAVFVCDRGSVWMKRYPLIFNHSAIISADVFFYATRNADSLRREAERWAGPGLVTFSRHANTDVRVDLMYQRAGYQPIEHQFIRMLP